MKFFFYYAFHTFINNIKKLFKTWVAVFIAVCLVFGIIIGVSAAIISDIAEKNNPTEPGEVTEQPGDPENPDDPEEEIDPEKTKEIMELIITAAAVIIIAFNVLTAEKNGSGIFLMADVNLLFSAPIRPQSVLMFRLLMQFGTAFAGSLYLIFQIPNLILNAGIDAWTAVSLIFAWFAMLMYGKILNVLVYSVTSTYEKTKKLIRPVVYGIILITGVAFFVYRQNSGAEVFDAAVSFFNSPVTRYIPVIGWIKGFTVFIAERNIMGAAIEFALSVVGLVLLIIIIRGIKVDFYEDAMAKSSETAELMRAQSEGVRAKRKKDRKDTLVRDRLNRGSGANIYFFKAMYNRFRFAHFKYFTKTSETYLIVAIGVSLLLKYVIKAPEIVIVALALGGVAFFRSMGNPLREDTENVSFLLVPEKPFSKLFYSLLGGTLNCLLDLLPAIIVASVILRANIFMSLALMLFIVTIDFYSVSVGAFIDLSLPSSINQTVKTFVQIMFIYFGLIPVAVPIIIGFAIHAVPVFILISSAVCVGIGFLFLAFTPGLMLGGRK